MSRKLLIECIRKQLPMLDDEELEAIAEACGIIVVDSVSSQEN